MSALQELVSSTDPEISFQNHPNIPASLLALARAEAILDAPEELRWDYLGMVTDLDLFFTVCEAIKQCVQELDDHDLELMVAIICMASRHYDNIGDGRPFDSSIQASDKFAQSMKQHRYNQPFNTFLRPVIEELEDDETLMAVDPEERGFAIRVLKGLL